jgi:hypothetical protein
MKLFKIFENLPFTNYWNSKILDKLPSKEFLLAEFYNRTKYPYKGSLKSWNSNKQKLFDIELEIIRELIDNYPAHVFEKIDTIEDFTLECLIPEILYKISTGRGDLGFVLATDKKVELHYTTTYLKYRALHPAEKEFKYNRVELKKIILDLIK